MKAKSRYFYSDTVHLYASEIFFHYIDIIHKVAHVQICMQA